MKKAALITSFILIIAVVAMVFVGCTNVPANKALRSLWETKEITTYEIKRFTPMNNTEGSERTLLSSGELTITIERISGDTISIGGHTVDNFIGSMVTMSFKMEDGSFMDSKVAFTAKFVPVASYKNSFIKGYTGTTVEIDTTETITAKYIGENYEYVGVTKVVEATATTKEGSLKTGTWSKSPFMDNLMLYHVARSSFSGKNSAFQAMSMNVPSWSENAMKTVSFSLVSSDTKIAAMGQEEMSTTKIQVARSQKFPGPGMPNYVYFNNTPFELEGDHMATAGQRVIVRVEEREMEYTLKTFKSHK